MGVTGSPKSTRNWLAAISQAHRGGWRTGGKVTLGLVATVVTGLLGQFIWSTIAPKPKLVACREISSLFITEHPRTGGYRGLIGPLPSLYVAVTVVTIANRGSATATNISVFYASRPHQVDLSPNLSREENDTSAGFEIRIRSLDPGTTVVLRALRFDYSLPEVLDVRSETGSAVWHERR